jgi:hypothetical protein
MFRNTSLCILVIVVLALGITTPVHAQAVLGQSSNYTENFDSIGTTGTVPQLGWRVYQIAGSSSAWTNTTGSNSVPAIGAIPNGTTVAGGTVSPGLVANNNPTGNQVNGYNATGASGAAADRGIATAPTGIAGSAVELQIINNSGLTQTGLFLSYDLRRYQVGADAAGRSPPAGIPEGSEELPGYWLFFSLDNGANYTAVNSLIPVGAGPSSQPIVPNTLGITSVAGAPVSFGSGNWNNGSTLFLRWVDDNAIDPSPDEIIGIDNIRLIAVPEPSSLILILALPLLAGRFRRVA